MYEKDKSLIIKAQKGDNKSLEQLMIENNRINMECCKKVYWKRY